MNERDLTVLSRFRENSRTSLTRLSKETKIPVSTIYDRVKEYEKKKYIEKHTILLDFKKMGYDIRLNMLIKANKEKKDELRSFLRRNNKVNNLYRISNGFDFMVDAVFKNIDEMDEFIKELEKQSIQERKDLFVMEELKRETFLSHRKNLGVMR